MMLHNRILTIFLFSISILGNHAYAKTIRDIPMSEVEAAWPSSLPPHPRLLCNDQQLSVIKQNIDTLPAWQGFYEALIHKADGIINKKPVTRKKTGKRLLSVSRDCLDRTLTLSMAYRLCGKSTYAQRAEKEMLAAANFLDWNPSHFLDVAEMTAALALGYDWLYHELSAESRKLIKQAILEKGLQPSYAVTHWVKGHNNWNQVCNGGITLGALALMEDEPELAQQTVHRAVNGIQHAMKQYDPDGAYPEGPGYWVYGTSFNCLFLAALESVLHTDFALSQMTGFARCADYYLHVTGPTGLYFNYPDSGSKGSFCETVFWFAHKYDRSDWAWTQHQLWQQALDKNPQDLLRGRLSPLTLLWANSEA
ncbi:MAG: DUF4962 domain-containing protein, partial [Bacteroidales bacterium]|nr:DUF4962 domain-containing protein [Bacteroidales bacterium]